MRNRSREFLSFVAAAGLLFCCSCERHYPDELQPPEREFVKSDEQTKAAAEKSAREKRAGDQQQMSTTALTPTPSPTPSPALTPANFFPSPTP